MDPDCLSFAEVPHTSRLFLDFLEKKPTALRFYGGARPLQAPVRAMDAAQRRRLADALLRQNQRAGAAAKALENIGRIREGANVIVTGQQAGLFGGPLLAMLKAMTAIKLAEQVGAVPVFWMATTDHDLAEIDHVALARDGKLTTVRAELSAIAGAMTSDAVIASDASSEIEQMFPDADACVLGKITAAYRKGERMGMAFAKLWASLFSEFGLVLIDPDDAELQELAKPVYVDAAKRGTELVNALLQRAKELDHSGYHVQVKIAESSALLFVEIDGARTPVRVVRELTGATEMRAGDLHWASAAEFASWVESHFERVTPNALLRPVVQDALLPTLAYVGGPAEIAYFAQSAVLYDALLGGRTPILARVSATLLDAKTIHLMEKYKLSMREMLRIHSEEELRIRLAKHVLPQNLADRFGAAKERLVQELSGLRQFVSEFDATLAGAAENAAKKIDYQVRKLEERAARAQLRRESDIARHAALLWSVLRPHGELQERQIAGVQFLVKGGESLIGSILGQINIQCAGHQTVAV